MNIRTFRTHRTNISLLKIHKEFENALYKLYPWKNIFFLYVPTMFLIHNAIVCKNNKSIISEFIKITFEITLILLCVCFCSPHSMYQHGRQKENV